MQTKMEEQIETVKQLINCSGRFQSNRFFGRQTKFLKTWLELKIFNSDQISPDEKVINMGIIYSDR